MPSVFDRIRAGLAKTAQQIRQRLGAETAPAAPAAPAAPGSGPGRGLPVDSFDAIEDALISADVGLPATERIINAVKSDRDGSLGDRVARVMLGIFRDARPVPAVETLPHVILVVGVNGTGKTTTVG